MSQLVNLSGAVSRLNRGFMFRRSAVALAIGAALVASQPLLAAEGDAVELEEITVTGTRIQQSVGMTTPTPVASLATQELLALSPGNITDAMTQLPQFYNSATAQNFGPPGSNGFFTSPGGGSLDLRGIGSKRTLTLLDGRRVVSSSVYGGPDINTFPSAMLRRVETVTGGASAAYGTDAVSGVVNYILDTNFQGFQAQLQRGETEVGDGDSTRFGVSFGSRLGERAHVMFSADRYEQKAIESINGRDWYQGWGLVRSNAAGAGTSRDNPQLIPIANIRATNASVDGIVSATTPAGAPRMTFYSDGSFGPLTPGSYVSTGSNAQSGGGGYNNNDDWYGLLPSTKRTTFFGYTDLDLTSNTNLYLQGIYSNQKLRTTTSVGGFYAGGAFQNFTIYEGNPFLGDPATPGTAANWMQTNGITSFTLGRVGGIDDFGKGHLANNTETVSGTAGFSSNISSGGYFDGWNVQGYAQYGVTDLDAVQEDGVRVDRIFLAADAVVDPATGQAVCRVTLVSGLVPDCVPINLFGRGQMSQSALDWVTGFDPYTPVTVTPFLVPPTTETYSYIGGKDKLRRTHLTQSVFELSASGKVANGWAGDITAAVGAHYRREAVDQKVQASQGNPSTDPAIFPAWCNDGATATQCITQIDSGVRPPGNIGVRGVPNGVQTNTVELQFSKVPFIRGDFDIKEVFAETIVPLMSDAGWLQDLNFQGAVRWADYAGSGSIWSYKGGLDAQFARGLRLRGTYSRDVRAANIGERFDRTGGFANINDPVLGPPAYGITTVTGGNPNVSPEKADTYTMGVVYRPEWLDGFDVSVDWLSVSLKDAIESIGVQTIVDSCYIDGDVDQCAQITRDPVSNQITFVNAGYQNLSKAKISGIDGEIGYSRRITLFGGGERLGIRAFVSWLDENSRTNSVGLKTDSAGNASLQLNEWKATAMLNYSNGPLRWNLSARYTGGGYQSSTWNVADDAGVVATWNVADNHIGSVTYFDTRLGYDIRVGSGMLELYANVNNLLDRDPPRVMQEFAVGTLYADSTYNTIFPYDVQGRRYSIGVNLKF